MLRPEGGRRTTSMRPAAARFVVREGLQVPEASLVASLPGRRDLESEQSQEPIFARILNQRHTSAARLLSAVDGAVSRFQQNRTSVANESNGSNVPTLALASLQPAAVAACRPTVNPGVVSPGSDRRVGEYQLIDPRKHRQARVSVERLRSDGGAVLACAVNDSHCFASFSQAFVGSSPPVASAVTPCKRGSKQSRDRRTVQASTASALYRRAGEGRRGLDRNSDRRHSSSSPSPTRSPPSLSSTVGSPSRHSGYQRSRTAAKPRGVWRHLVAGGMAGAASRTATAPLETLRLRMMVASSKSVNLGQACKQIWSEAGWRAFFRGNMLNVLRSTPQKALDFFVFESFKQLLSKDSQPPTGVQTVIAGAMAGATSTLILYPLDVVRSRLTVSSVKQSTGLVSTFHRIASTEGVGALYKGLGPSLLSIIPEAAITYGCFDLLKEGYRKATGGKEAGVVPSLACGVASAFTGQLVAYPLELVSRHMQVAASNPATHQLASRTVASATSMRTAAPAFAKILVPRGLAGVLIRRGGASPSSLTMMETIQRIVAQRGVGGLYQGIVPASMKVIPMAMVSFGVYETVKYVMEQLEHGQEEENQLST